MEQRAVLVTNLYRKRARSHGRCTGRVDSIASVSEINYDVLRGIGDQAVRHRIEAIKSNIVLVNIGVVMVCHEECVEAGIASVGVLQIDMVVDGILITDAGQHPLCLDSVAAGIQHIAGESVSIRDNDRRTAVDFIAELDERGFNSVIVKKGGLDSVRTHIVGKGAVSVIEEGGDHSDFRANQLTIGEADENIVNIPSRTDIGS